MPTLVLLWVWVCAYLNCAGWALSALHQLNAGGYAVVLALGAVALIFWRRQSSPDFFSKIHWRKYARRFRRPFPLAFLILATMAFLGGAIYAPTNYDALAYREPRVLHWLAENHWHWIHTVFDRINTRSCGIEWVSAPFLALLKSDRLLFLINIVSFLLLPGLVFSMFTRLGVRRRVAWHWMWIAPTGYCFLLQAGSIGNDLFGAAFALAAVDFALRARNSESPRDLFASMLAAALMTSVKLSSLPLLLPWAVAFLPSLKILFRAPVRAAAVSLIALAASGLPTMVQNAIYFGDWSGAHLNHHPGIFQTVTLRTSANLVSIGTQNLVPSVFPPAGRWNEEVKKILPDALETRLRAVMVEPQAYDFSVPEMQTEEDAGLGFGVSIMALISVTGAFFVRQPASPTRESTWLVCVRWSPVISLLALLTQYNLSLICRIITPYYLLLLPALLALGGHEKLINRAWWRVTVFAVFLMAAGLLVVSPARPLFPVETILSKIQRPDSRLAARINEVYSVYHNRNDGFAPARAILPPDLKVLGMITFDDPETSLWRPFGSRRIEHICPEDTPAELKARGIEYILIHEEKLDWYNLSLDDWLKKMNAQLVQKIPLNLRASRGPLDWDLVKLN
jgi:hypothetical protein